MMPILSNLGKYGNLSHERPVIAIELSRRPATHVSGAVATMHYQNGIPARNAIHAGAKDALITTSIFD